MLDWIIRRICVKGKNFRVILSCLAWNASVCYLWLEKNAIMFGKNARNEEALKYIPD